VLPAGNFDVDLELLPARHHRRYPMNRYRAGHLLTLAAICVEIVKAKLHGGSAGLRCLLAGSGFVPTITPHGPERPAGG